MTDLKAKIMEQAEHAFASAKAAKDVDGMTRATEILMRIWLEETARYAQVRAPVVTYGVGYSYSGDEPAPDQPETKPSECACGASYVMSPATAFRWSGKYEDGAAE